MKNLMNMNIKNFLDKASSKSPVPGGGSASALAGAMSAALVSKVCCLTIGKKGYEKVQKEIKQILKESEKIKKILMDLTTKDSRAYLEVIKSYKSKRRQSIEAPLKQAAKIPLDTCFFSKAVLNLAERAVRIGNKQAVSDAKVAYFLAASAIKGALENVKINLVLIKDERFKKEMSEKMKKM